MSFFSLQLFLWMISLIHNRFALVLYSHFTKDQQVLSHFSLCLASLSLSLVLLYNVGAMSRRKENREESFIYIPHLHESSPCVLLCDLAILEQLDGCAVRKL
jgi:hypothetical protein